MIQSAGTILVGSGVKHKKTKANLEQLKAKDNQLVRGRFHWQEYPGGTFSFVYKKYKGDPVVRYDLKDGEVYELPLGVAKHLNNDVGRWEHSYLLDKDGKPSKMASTRVRRVQFESLEFMDIEEIGPSRIEEVKIEDLPPLKD